MNRNFASGREFSLIESLFDPSHFTRDGKALGDDGFLLQIADETWAISTDSSVEGIHFRMDWGGLGAALEKSLPSNLSDINAMGGKASLVFFSLGGLKSWSSSQTLQIASILRDMESKYQFRIVGGDTVLKEKECFFNFTVLGKIQDRPLLRSAAQPGHQIYLSGKLGRSAAGLSLFQQGHRPGSNLAWDIFFEAHLRPTPPLTLGPLLGKHIGPVSAIDISDGLSSEISHLSKQSSCRMVLEWSKLRGVENIEKLPGGENFKEWILNGGEEYQLLFTGDFSEQEIIRLKSLSGHSDIMEIGTVQQGQGVGLIDEMGREFELNAQGWNH